MSRRCTLDLDVMLTKILKYQASIRYKDVAAQLEQDERFKAVDTDRERTELFEDHVIKLERAERERLRAAREKNIAAFNELLAATEGLTSKSR